VPFHRPAAIPPARFDSRVPKLSRLATLAYVACAAAPLAFLTVQVATWIRNVPNWDEFDTVLAFLLKISEGGGWNEFVHQCLAVNNEHRMLASRLIFAACYWLSGGIDFAVLAVIGNLFLAGAFGVLLAREQSGPARLRLAAVFGLAVFHLQHHESLFWAGSSIDHFFVVLVAVTAFGALAAGSRGGLLVAAAAAFLASYSLAHGLLVWPVGLVLLALQRRRRAAWAWSAAGAVTLATFFAGFALNPGHPMPGISDLLAVAVYALRLVGSSAAIGDHALAPWLGGLFLVGAGFAAMRGATSREGFAFAIIGWCVAAMAMIAWGRALLSNEWAPVASRYVILSSVAWGLLIWLLLERLLTRQPRVAWWPAPILGALASFNLAANLTEENSGRIFAAAAENTVWEWREHGTFAHALVAPYPDPERADALIRATGERGIYRLPQTALPFARPRPVPVGEPAEISNASYFIEDVVIDLVEIRVRGWAFRPNETTRRGEISVVFRADDQLLAYEATPQFRPDVAKAFSRWDAIYAGFELRLKRARLPQGELGVGIGFDLDVSPEFMMTAHTVQNRSRQIATSQ